MNAENPLGDDLLPKPSEIATTSEDERMIRRISTLAIRGKTLAEMYGIKDKFTTNADERDLHAKLRFSKEGDLINPVVKLDSSLSDHIKRTPGYPYNLTFSSI